MSETWPYWKPFLISFSEPLGAVKNLQVIDPTITTLNVRWEPAEGNVREYKVVYVPAGGGQELTVRGDSWQLGGSYGWSDMAGHSSDCLKHFVPHMESLVTDLMCSSKAKHDWSLNNSLILAC